MKITIHNLLDQTFVLHLQKEEHDETSEIAFIWRTESEDSLSLKILETETGSVYDVLKGADIATHDDDIIAQFEEQKSAIIEAENAGIEFTEEQEIVDDGTPFDPEEIRVDTKQFSVSFINELIEAGEIDLSPDFQRHFVWKDLEKRSRLIESIMLRIPLPVFYLSQDKEGKFQVVDGLQRLSVINQFLTNKFKLTNLEYLEDQEEKYYEHKTKDNIDAKYKRRISQTQLTVNVIDPQTPTRVKFEIFKRINQGGKPLDPQEIRNCMISKSARDLLRELTKSESFLNATNNGINPLRMQDQEMVLRFIGFYYEKQLNRIKYKGAMTSFLDDLVDMLNHATEQELAEIKRLFYLAMDNALHLFGKYAFRKCNTNHLLPNARKQFVNKSIFTAWSVHLSQFSKEYIQQFPQGYLALPLAKKIESDPEYYRSITEGTNSIQRMDYSFKVAKEITDQFLKK